MRFLVIGGAGNVGEAVIRYLLKFSDVEEVVCGDVDLNRARKLASKINDDRVVFEYVNARDVASLTYAMSNVDVVLAPLPPIPDLYRNVVDAALECGCHYIDFASAMSVLYHHFSMSDVIKDAGITLLTCMGEDPGLSDILARYGSEKLDVVDAIRVRDGAVASGKGVLCTYSPTVFLGEVTTPGIIYEDGRIKHVDPLSGKEVYNFPDPVGPLPTYFVPHEEPVTIPRGLNKSVRYVDFKLALTDDAITTIKVLKSLGLLSKRPIKIDGIEISPLDFLLKVITPPAELAGVVKGHDCLVVEVSGEKAGKKVTYRYYTYMSHDEAYRKYGVTATAYLTGTMGAIAALLIARGVISERGVVVPAQLPPDILLKEAKEAGIPIHEEVLESS